MVVRRELPLQRRGKRGLALPTRLATILAFSPRLSARFCGTVSSASTPDNTHFATLLPSAARNLVIGQSEMRAYSPDTEKQ